MNGITLETKLRDIYALPEMKPYARYMIYTPGEDPENSWHAPYTVQGLEKIGWRGGAMRPEDSVYQYALTGHRMRIGAKWPCAAMRATVHTAPSW